MVWGVCRRVLRNHHDAEDAFQATFLVLVRKAASLASPELLANWLYGVAHQTAIKARATTAKRSTRERQVTQMPEPTVTEPGLWNDLQPLLDQELSRLPDAYRAILVLCDLEGKTRKQVAQQLGVPEGTVGSRLARARTMLAKRLARHGLTVSGGALAAVLPHDAASACVPPSVVSSTIKAASVFAAGQAAAAGMISAQAAALTEGVLKAMLLTKFKVLTAVLLAVTLLGSGAVLLSSRTLGQDSRPRQNDARLQPAGTEDGKAKSKEDAKKDRERLQGSWKLVAVDGSGKPKNLIVPGEDKKDEDVPGEPKKDEDVPGEPKKVVDEVDGRFVFSGDEFTAKKGFEVLYKGKFKLDISKSPKAIDLKIVEALAPNEDNEGKTVLGIYALDGDDLKLCLATPGEEDRPTKLAGEAGKHVLLTLKREKN
jgi:RNA polymerase sigma factor (sigma-70 family)